MPNLQPNLSKKFKTTFSLTCAVLMLLVCIAPVQAESMRAQEANKAIEEADAAKKKAAQAEAEKVKAKKQAANERQKAEAMQDEAEAAKAREEAAKAEAKRYKQEIEALKAKQAQQTAPAPTETTPAPTPAPAKTTAAVKNTPVTQATPHSYKDCDKCPTIEMIQVPRGTFIMGAGSKYTNEIPEHSVSVDYDFEIGKFEVTQAEWQAVMGSNPSRFKNCGPNCPVEQVSWDDIQTFIQKLNQLTKKNYRLPTEAEWEYAARAGTGNQYQYSGSNNIDEVAWYEKNSNNTTHPVGQKKANAWGLHDMSGNVWEWVQDGYHENYNGAPSNASQAWDYGEMEKDDQGRPKRVLRGGSWSYGANYARAADRVWNGASVRNNDNGFRLARTLP